MVRRFILVIILCALGLIACRPKMPPPSPIVSNMYPLPAYIEGKNMTAAQVESLKASLEKDHSDSWSNAFNRIQLLGYYSNREDAESQANASKQIVWIATNNPTVNLCWLPLPVRPSFSKEEFDALKQTWIEQVEKNPTEPIVFCNTAHFLLPDDKQKVETLLDRASKLSNDNPDICGLIGEYYSRCSISQTNKATRDRLILSSIVQFEKALDLIDRNKFVLSLSREGALATLAKETYRMGQTEGAANYASQLLETVRDNTKTTRFQSNYLNLANTILGMKAIENGDTDSASNYLLESGKGREKMIGAPPSLCLAAALLNAGKRRVVMQHLRDCETVLAFSADGLHRWEAMIDNGETPQFNCEPDTWYIPF